MIRNEECGEYSDSFAIIVRHRCSKGYEVKEYMVTINYKQNVGQGRLQTYVNEGGIG